MTTLQSQKLHALPADARIGPFRILCPLNESGGMATLYLVEVRDKYRREGEPARMALKIARIDYEDFLRAEAGILARLADNPRIVKIHRLPGWGYPVYWGTDTIKPDGVHSERVCYMSMEYVEGVSLRKTLERHGRLRASVAVGIARQVAAALSHAHSQNIIHLDIKPENILLRRRRWAWLRSSVPEVVLCDFGIARDLNSPARVGRAGSLDYLAPEVLMEANPAHRLVSFPADVYMLGEVLYEMLSGHLPVEGPHQKMAGMAVPPLDIGGQQLEALVMRAVARDPKARYASAAELQRALHAVPAGVDIGMLARQATAGVVAAGAIAGSIWLGTTIWRPRELIPTLIPSITVTRTQTPTHAVTFASREPTVTRAPTRTFTPRPVYTPTGSMALPANAAPPATR
jgi:serine/threonine protein kinase